MMPRTFPADTSSGRFEPQATRIPVAQSPDVPGTHRSEAFPLARSMMSTSGKRSCRSVVFRQQRRAGLDHALLDDHSGA